MQKLDYLFELGCEELPTSAMLELSHALKKNIEENLTQQSLQFATVESFVSPRRLAILVSELDEKQSPRTVERRGPNKSAAYDNDGTPTLACLGFANACGVSLDELQIKETEKGAWVYCEINKPGQQTNELLPGIVNTAILKLPLPKPMRWGNHDFKFIRPVHWITSLLGEKVVELNLFNIQSQRQTYGHRFMHPAAIALTSPASYYERLLQFGKVMPCFSKRRQYIAEQLKTAADKIGFTAIIKDDLLNEVTTLVEWPVILTGTFPIEYLNVPQEALISAMQSHQKCFAVVNHNNKLQPHFILVSNIESNDPNVIIKGNERVINARLSDAAFFYHQDLKNSLSSHLQQLEQVIFQKDLGSLASKSERISELAKAIAKKLGADQRQAARAGLICKCDLLSHMVYEFPELQGIMGYYYALQDDEGKDVALAIKEHYYPRHAGDQLPSNLLAASVALADKLDTLVGIIALNKLPKGDKDPFALRRAALGIVRIIIENRLDLNLSELLEHARKNHPTSLPNKNSVGQAHLFILDRVKSWCQENHITIQIYNAINKKSVDNLYDFYLRSQAVKHFLTLEESTTLAAANKRVNNILKKNKITAASKISKKLLKEDAEKALFTHLTTHVKNIEALFKERNYTATLAELAHFKKPIDNFFDEVMVMCDDKALRQNRLAIVQQLQHLFTLVADLGLLQK